MGQGELQVDNHEIDELTSSEMIAKLLKAAIFFTDGAISGYLLICVSIAFLTIASLEEVLAGTENKILHTKFVDASNMHLFVESAFLVHSLILAAHVIGPIMGGAINTMEGMQDTCIDMGIFGSVCLVIYLVFAIFVWCTVHRENHLSLREMDVEQNTAGDAFNDNVRMINTDGSPTQDPEESRLLGNLSRD